MISVKANISRFSLKPLVIALVSGLLSTAIATGQDDYSFPPWAGDDMAETGYNYAVAIDVLSNDYRGNLPIDSSTFTIVSGPQSGEAEFDDELEMVIYTPDENFAGSDQFEYKVADGTGNYSNTATVDIWVHNEIPWLSLDYYHHSGDTWVFYGNVWDENPGVCTVTFGGILEGETAEPDANGDYTLYVLLDNGEEGLVTAQMTDEVGEDSNVAQDYVYRY